MKDETTKKQQINNVVTQIVASRIGRMLIGKFRSIVEDKKKWNEMSERVRMELLNYLDRKGPKAVKGKEVGRKSKA